MTDTSAEAAKQRAREQLSAATAALVTVGNMEAEQEAARRKAEREAKKAAEEEARKKVGGGSGGVGWGRNVGRQACWSHTDGACCCSSGGYA